MSQERKRSSPKIPRYGLKWFVSLIAVLFSIIIGTILADLFQNYHSGLSTPTIQVLEATEFLPLFLACGFMIRYSAQWLMSIPHLTTDTVIQYEKSVARGGLSLVMLIIGLLWLAGRLLTEVLLVHAIFTLPSLVITISFFSASWYSSKAGTYRRAVYHSGETSSRPENQLPTLRGFLTGIKHGTITIEKIGLERGLPTCLIKIESDRGEDTFLNIGVERLLPTALVQQGT
jgi:hypothetical protein